MTFLQLPKPESRVQQALIGLYIAQAIPVYLISAALPAIFRAQGIDLATIGSLALLMLPWILRFLWAPLIDRWQPAWPGPRKGWIIPMHLCVVSLITVLAFLDPAKDLHLFFPLALVMALCSATQDIATDGYAVEHLNQEQLAFGNAIQGGSVAAGVLIGGSTTLFFYDQVGWTISVLIAAGLSLTALVPMVLVPESAGKTDTQHTNTARRPSLWAFLKRPEARNILYFALIFRCSEGLVKAMEQPFMVDKGLSLTSVGLLSGGAAATAGLGGAAIAALCINNMGQTRFLWGIGIARSFCFAGFLIAAMTETVSAPLLIGLSFFNTVIRYMEMVGLYSLFMRHASRQQAGTDFTLLICANLLVYMVGGMCAGVIANASGYETLFVAAFCLSVGGIIISMQFVKNQGSHICGKIKLSN